MPIIFLVAAAVAVIAMITYAYSKTTDTVSSVLTGPIGIGIAVAVVVVAAAAAWSVLGKKKTSSDGLSSKRRDEEQP
jgi:hypothetical protein